MRASILSVLAVRPLARAKSRARAGLTRAKAAPAALSAWAKRMVVDASGLKHDEGMLLGPARSIGADVCFAIIDALALLRGCVEDVEPKFGHIDAAALWRDGILL